MKLFYVPIIVGLLTLVADAADQPPGPGGPGGGPWGWKGRRHHDPEHKGHHHGGHHGHGHCKRGRGCATVTFVGSVVDKLDSPLFKQQVVQPKDGEEYSVPMRGRQVIKPGDTISCTLFKYTDSPATTGIFQDVNCGPIISEFKGSIKMTFSKEGDAWKCALSYPKLD